MKLDFEETENKIEIEKAELLKKNVVKNNLFTVLLV